MYLIAILVTFVSLVAHYVVAHREYEGSNEMGTIQERLLTDGGDSFCYGTDAICSVSFDLSDACDNFFDSGETEKWYECLCGNGYVSVNEQ
jgi:hypothetical protein